MNASRVVTVLAAAFLAVAPGCAVTDNGFDAGSDVPSGTDVHNMTDTGPRTDTGTRTDSGGGGRDVVLSLDSGGTGGSGTVPLYGRCTTGGDCRDMGAGCLQAFPGGICAKACTSAADCGSGRCVPLGDGTSICLPSCTSGGGECSTVGGACVPVDMAGTSFACVPSCYATPPSGTPACNSPLMCDPYAGSCGAMASTGADNGAACTMDSDCRGGRCITEVDTSGTPSGFLGGFCLSFGVSATITMGAPVPQSNCPPGSGAVPLNGEGPGDSVPCFKTCNTATDCRAGYQCDHLTTSAGGSFFSNGICLPLDCSQSGMTCPSGTTCRTMTAMDGTMYGVCAH